MLMTPKEFVSLSVPSGVDGIYQKSKAVNDFVFDQEVVNVFPDMIGRSVPGYWAVTDRTALIASRFWQPKSTVYDLGASLGAVSWALWNIFPENEVPIVAIELSKPMVQRFRRNLSQTQARSIEVNQGDVRQEPLDRASVVILNYTLQFIPSADRRKLLEKIYSALLPGGVLLLSEKIALKNEQANALIRRLHHDWKHQQGYSWQEIEKKSEAISRVMPVDDLKKHCNRLESVGFSTPLLWNQQYNFVSLLAIK